MRLWTATMSSIPSVASSSQDAAGVRGSAVAVDRGRGDCSDDGTTHEADLDASTPARFSSRPSGMVYGRLPAVARCCLSTLSGNTDLLERVDERLPKTPAAFSNTGGARCWVTTRAVQRLTAGYA